MYWTFFYWIITFICIFLTRKIQYHDFRYSEVILKNKELKKRHFYVMLISYIVSIVPIIHGVALGVLLFEHANRNWTVLFLPDYKKRWFWTGEITTYWGTGLGFIPYVTSSTTTNDLPQWDDYVALGLKITLPFIHTTSYLILKYRR